MPAATLPSSPADARLDPGTWAAHWIADFLRWRADAGFLENDGTYGAAPLQPEKFAADGETGATVAALPAITVSLGGAARAAVSLYDMEGELAIDYLPDELPHIEAAQRLEACARQLYLGGEVWAEFDRARASLGDAANEWRTYSVQIDSPAGAEIDPERRRARLARAIRCGVIVRR